jgi:hypothetical protein
MKTCRTCGSRGNHHRGCPRRPAARPERRTVPQTRRATRPVDDDYLVIRALWMAADLTHRDDLRPHYIRLAEEREAIRKSQLADIPQ